MSGRREDEFGEWKDRIIHEMDVQVLPAVDAGACDVNS